MIADALDEPGELALGGAAGFAAGLVAALLMLAFLAVWHPNGVPRPGDLLRAIGVVVPGFAGAGAQARLAAGAAVHLGCGGLFGLLYGACQHRVPSRGLAVTGAFHGFLIWVASGLAARAGFAAPVRPFVHSRAWLTACLVYGLALGAAAVLSKRRPPAAGLRPVPVD